MPLTLVLLLASCGEFSRHTFPHTPTEITVHPEILYNKTIDRKDMTYMGVKLGDPGFSVRKERVINEAPGGWFLCRDSARYRVEDKTVVAFGIWDAPTIERLYISSPGDIEKKFGKPEQVIDERELLIYYYSGGHISVLWNKQESQLNAVNVSNVLNPHR